MIPPDTSKPPAEIVISPAKVDTPETLKPVVRPTISIPPPLIVTPPLVTFIPSLKVLIPRASTCFTSSYVIVPAQDILPPTVKLLAIPHHLIQLMLL